MRIMPAAVAYLAMLTAAPAFARQAEPSPAAAPPTAESPAEPTTPPAPKSAEELAVEAQARDLSQAMRRMQDELVAAYPGGDVEAIVAPYRAQADALAGQVETLLTARAAAAATPEERAALEAERDANGPKIRAMPDTIARTVMHALANRRAAPDAQTPSE